MINSKNKKRTNLTTLVISITLCIMLLTTIIILLNNLKMMNKSNISTETPVYNIYRRLWKFKQNGGIVLQGSASILGYLGITISSVFDDDIKNDMNAIDWNPFNTNEQLVLNSKKVSFYKGVPVFRFNYNRSGSFLAIFLTNSRYTSIDVVKHEWGHNVQQLILGPVKYGLCIGLPSWLEWSNRSYYDRPWEITADIFGEITSRTYITKELFKKIIVQKHSTSDIERGYSYLDTSASFGILSYLFLLGEY